MFVLFHKYYTNHSYIFLRMPYLSTKIHAILSILNMFFINTKFIIHLLNFYIQYINTN